MYSATGEDDKPFSSTSVQQCQRFSLAEIQSATKNFHDDLVIGHGGFGKVYKGQLSTDEPVVAIKRLSSVSNQGEHEFRAEIETLGTLSHRHLVSLIGYCDDNQERILVYRYMMNGTLYHHLHKLGAFLNWFERLNIAYGAGCGLAYLHTQAGTEHGIIHRDVKSLNILLDENFVAKISDFGLSKIGPTNQSSSSVDASGVKGTFGYLDPEYFYTKKVSRKTDVYAFGVVLFELLTGRLAVDESCADEQYSLVRWAQKCVKEKKLNQMVDSNIKGSVSPKCLRRFAQLADRCVHSNLKERPTMTEVVASLQAILELQLKSEDSTKSSGIMGFTWRSSKYLPPAAKQNSDYIGTSLSRQQSERVRRFTFDELNQITRNFQETYSGKGNDNVAYKGWVEKLTYSPCNHSSGLPVVVKRFHHYIQMHEMLKECDHPNIVKLIGYCMKDEQLFLAHEFMQNFNFEDLICCGVVARLPLVKKVQIAFGVARGILFLHKVHLYFGANDQKIKPMFERRDIMLDKDCVAKLSNYGINKYFSYDHLCSIFLPVLEGRMTMTEQDFQIKLLESGVATYRSFYELYPKLKPMLEQCGEGSMKVCREKVRGMIGDYVFACESRWSSSPRELLQMDLSGFTVILAEVVTGRRIFNNRELDMVDDKLGQHGKTSMRQIARLCFESCYNAESELKMLEFLKEYESISECLDQKLHTATLEDETFYTAAIDEHEDETFSITSFKSCE